ncbi:uncharacterized protein DUF4157 [Cohnella sp. SGD-V74]|uniref:eCIS core domain-containing protein n=1 Tax=unclassified Cohnella TaxID=2636738 RepID=UPI000D4BB086|nr:MULTISPECIES: DUF4157 domain-containing protein [unclassified Cohnella]PRX62388.1 uncharacterized protein DUF4157 [Cohnella sp. SGD-V74]
MHLQQTIGNSAVSQLMQTWKRGPDSGVAEGQTQANDTGMPDSLKAGLEGLSGIDLSDVRVHYNSDKPARINAMAYTQGSEIYLAPGQERHLPHEGWHAVQQKQGRVQATVQAKGMPVNDSQVLEREADAMGERASRHTSAGAGSGKRDAAVDSTAPIGSTNSANQPIQGMFVLTRTYTPNDDNVRAFLGEDEIKLVRGRNYVVKGFDFNGNVILHESQSGRSFSINRDLDHLFSVVPDEGEEVEAPVLPQPEHDQPDHQQLVRQQEQQQPLAPTFIGFSEEIAGSWTPQIFETGCWLAVMAVISGKTQQQMQEELGWGDDAFYTVTSNQLAEFAQLVQCPITEITNDQLTAEFVAQTLGEGNPIGLGVPDHAMILFAISSDLSLVRIWDPANCRIQQISFQLMKKHIEDAFVRS